MTDFDVSQITKLAVDLGKGNAGMVTGARKILEVASIKIKKDMAAEISQSPHFKAVAPAISYDIKGLSSEIGPVIGKAAGSLAFIAAHGTATHPPSWDYTAALHREAPIAEKLLGELAAKTIL
jgi:hypothetical protein